VSPGKIYGALSNLSQFFDWWLPNVEQVDWRISVQASSGIIRGIPDKQEEKQA
jgi:hypothetical protein